MQTGIAAIIANMNPHWKAKDVTLTSVTSASYTILGLKTLRNSAVGALTAPAIAKRVSMMNRRV